MKNLHLRWTVPILAVVLFTGCGAPHKAPVERYVSPQVQGEAQKINLTEVQQAFFDTKGKDFNTWMGAFEKRVNEIYEGKEVISIDATRETGKLIVSGYIEDKKEQGWQKGEEKLFSIEQTGDVVNNELPYRVAGADGRPYYEGHHSILGSPFVQMMVLSHLMGGWGGRYHTPYPQTVILRDHRDSFRTTPSYSAQQASNQKFHTSYKQKASGDGFMSKKTFGSGQTTSISGSSRRSWGGFGSSSTSTRPTSGWGGRRSFGMSGGWGGRRRGR